MHFSTVAAILGLLTGAMGQFTKWHAFKIEITRFIGNGTCVKENALQEDYHYMTPGGCHSPKQQQEFDAVFFDREETWDEPDNDSDKKRFGNCQLNAHEEPHCKGRIVMRSYHANVNITHMRNRCERTYEGYHGKSLQLKCSKNGPPVMAGDYVQWKA